MQSCFEDMSRSRAIVRARIDGEMLRACRSADARAERKSTRSRSWSIASSIRPDIQQRLTDSLETAAEPRRRAGDRCTWWKAARTSMFSQNYACPDCGISIEELDTAHVLVQQSLWRVPRSAPAWACCSKMDPDIIIPDRTQIAQSRARSSVSGWNTSDDARLLWPHAYLEGTGRRLPFFAGHAGLRVLPEDALDTPCSTARAAKRSACRIRARKRQRLLQRRRSRASSPIWSGAIAKPVRTA